MKAIKVTVTDPDSGEVLAERVVDTSWAPVDMAAVLTENDYVILTAGNRYVDGVQTHANGTHVLTVKVDRGAS